MKKDTREAWSAMCGLSGLGILFSFGGAGLYRLYLINSQALWLFLLFMAGVILFAVGLVLGNDADDEKEDEES